MLSGMDASRTHQSEMAPPATTEKRISVLFVCMGNICRSPTAEGMFRKIVEDAGLADRFHVASAGTHAYHVGAPPDNRAQSAAARRGVTLTHMRARRVSDEDFAAFDYIFAMDRDNLGELLERAPEEHREKVMLFLDFAGTGRTAEVPDPYYGGASGFELVLDLVEQASERLLQRIRSGRLRDGEGAL
ncbi:MAG TPA: low molecular weight protein-tyrosine-phosphatase [Woeseiaceae bacterium]